MSLEESMGSLKKSIDALNETFSKMSATPAARPAAAAKPAAAALLYEDIKVPFLDLCKKKGKEAGIALCKQFGHESLKTVKPEQFADVLTAIKKSLAEETLA